MKSNDIIRFRVTPEERARIQALADKTTRGNISSMIKNLLDRAIREEAAKTQRTETRYELKTASCEVRDRRQLVDGCCDDHPDPTIIATFRTKDEALAALSEYKSTARHYSGIHGVPYWFATQTWVEEICVTIDADGEEVEPMSVDVVRFAPWDRDYTKPEA